MSTRRFKVWTPRRQWFDALADACAAAEDYRKQTGVFVCITEHRRRASCRPASVLIRSILKDTGEWGCRESGNFIMLAFNAAHALNQIHGELADGFRPGPCAYAEWREVDPYIRKRLRRLTPATLRRLLEVAYRAGKLREACACRRV